VGDTFGETYGQLMRQIYGDSRIHVSTAVIRPHEVQQGMYVMYLPLEITEGEDMIPRVAQVTRVLHERGEIRVITTLGVMIFRPGEEVTVVA
jgi:hypothetical protein